MDPVSTFYAQPSHSALGGFPVFAGSRRQVGGNIFGSIARFTLPLLKNFGRKVGLPLLKTVGRKALGVAANVAADALQGRNAKEALKSHAREAALDTLQSLTLASSSASRRSRTARTKRRKQRGGGEVRSGRTGRSRRRRQRQRSRSGVVRMTKKKKAPSRKRSRSSSQSTRQKRKRRRTLSSYL